MIYARSRIDCTKKNNMDVIVIGTKGMRHTVGLFSLINIGIPAVLNLRDSHSKQITVLTFQDETDSVYTDAL